MISEKGRTKSANIQLVNFLCNSMFADLVSEATSKNVFFEVLPIVSKEQKKWQE